MMTGEGKAKRSLDVLPIKIGDVHVRLREVMEKLCVLDDFLLGVQVREVAPDVKTEAPSGVVDKCFDNLTAISNSIEECHGQLQRIIDKLGVASPEPPGKLQTKG